MIMHHMNCRCGCGCGPGMKGMGYGILMTKKEKAEHLKELKEHFKKKIEAIDEMLKDLE